MMVIDQMCLWIYCFSLFPFYVLAFQEKLVAADHVLCDDTHHCLQMDDDNEHDTIVMEDEDEAEVKEEDEEQELIIIPFKETCSKHIRGFRRHLCLYKYRLICAWQQDSRQVCTCGMGMMAKFLN